MLLFISYTMDNIKKAISNVAKENNADVFLFSAKVDDTNADSFISRVRGVKVKKENCILILTTNGGDPDAGYRMVRIIQQYYTRFILYVFGFCKSTGTLIAVGADKIVMGDFGEFGPLDIQMSGGDELNNTSGLSYLQSLISLNERIYSSFEQNFMDLKRYGITTKTAAEIGSKLAIGIVEPIASQIDPLKLGDVQRSIRIASFYADRIDRKNAETEGVKKLIGNYPSHSFVIDFKEIKTLFKNKIIVRPNEDEFKIEENLSALVREQSKNPVILYCEIEEEIEKNEPEQKNEPNHDVTTVEQSSNGY
jgi:hypothetical protein